MKGLILLILTLMAGCAVIECSDVRWDMAIKPGMEGHEVKIKETPKNVRMYMKGMKKGKKSSKESKESKNSKHGGDDDDSDTDSEDPPVPTRTSTTSTTVSSTSPRTVTKTLTVSSTSPHTVTKTLTVSSTSPHTVSTTSLSSTSSSTVSAESDVLSAPRGSWSTRIVVVVVCVAVLVLLIVLFLCFKRHRHFQNKKNENPNSKDEGHEVKSASGTGLKTIYVTAGMPTSPPPSEYYSTINLSYSAGQASDATYSTVQENNQTPEYSTINPPPGPGEDPFYSKLSHPQQN